jgi:hypothetical protein
MGDSSSSRPANLSEAEVKEIVRRSYQYVAMFQVIIRTVFAPFQPDPERGFNRVVGRTTLTDHDVKHIARPNNDTLVVSAGLDLRAEPVILELPAFDSTYVSLEVSGYDHYCEVVLSTRKGDFTKTTRVLFFTDRTERYHGEEVLGIDRIMRLSCDFSLAVIRVMPHLSEKARFECIVTQMQAVKLLTLAEFQGQPAKTVVDESFPAFDLMDAEPFGTRLLEVMQFVFNHTTFESNNEMDCGVLAVYKPLGVVPGKKYDGSTVAQICPALSREMAEQVADEARAQLAEPLQTASLRPKLFRPKGHADLETMLFQSVVGPVGLPEEEAWYAPVQTTDGQPMNATHDYILRMTRDQLPPAKAFWSLTLYDLKNGFFIPNDQKKYSVGHNAGMKLDRVGGIEIHVAAERPAGVAAENWLPINRGDVPLDLLLRLYVPDLGRMSTWEMPRSQRVTGP